MKSGIKIIAFLGSPRKNGNTELLLKEAMRGIEEKGGSLKTYNLNLMKIKACQDCGGCNETGRCIIEDDMGLIYQDIREADRIILASPIFFFALSAQAKVMIDRCQSFWCEKYLLKKAIEEGRFGRKGLLLLVGGMKKDVGIQCGEACAKAFFRTVSVQAHETLYYLGIDQKGDILHHPTALSEAYEAGKRLMEEE
ncbi:MAG: flavodoxin family protein [Nitrospiraceae bacterium]|nr:MAG: flavodoxin family protein [Nitrospiraceae bacterium]